MVLGSYDKLESLFRDQPERSYLDGPGVKSGEKKSVSLVEKVAPRAEPANANVPEGGNCSLGGILAGDLSEERWAVVRTYFAQVMGISLVWHRAENEVGGRLVMVPVFSSAEVTLNIVVLLGASVRKCLDEASRRVAGSGAVHGMPFHLAL